MDYYDSCKNEEDRINEDMLFDVFIIINGVIIGGIALTNRLLILNMLASLLYSFIDRLIYIKSFFDVKYDVYVKPVIGYVSTILDNNISKDKEESSKSIQINLGKTCFSL